MSQLTKIQLESENQSSFPNNTSNFITPQALREFNTDMIQSTVNQTIYTADSASFSQRITQNQGVQGIQGVQGLQGIQGVSGSQGIQGVQGSDATVQGIQGSTGIQGVQGLLGTQGVQGTQSTQGQTGPQGYTGNTGNVGSTGAQGIQGIQGVQGLDGQFAGQGVQGIQGNTGTQGAQGIQGITGAQGVSNISVQDEGSILGNATSFNFNGAGVSASVSAGTASITIAGGGGSTFPYTGSALITGSLGVTGSISSTLNSTFNGVTIGIGSGSVTSNIGIGSASLQSNTGVNSIGIGNASLQFNKSSNNTAVGNYTLAYQQFTGAGANTAIGLSAFSLLGSGSAALAAQLSQNTAVGNSAGFGLIVGARNTFIGNTAGSNADNVERMTGVGRGTLNVIGSNSINNGSGSKYNTAIGHNALFQLQSGSNNTIIHGGSAAGEGFITGSNNNVVGMDSGLPSSMEGNTIIGRGITGLSSPLSNNVILADGKGNIALQKNGTTGSVIIGTGLEVTNNVTASAFTAIAGNNKAFSYLAASSGGVNNTFNTALGKDYLDIYQYQGQAYAFNMHLTSDQLNTYSGSQFAFQLQTNGSGVSIPGGGATYFSMVSASYSSSVGPGTEIPGLNVLGAALFLDMKAPATFEQKVYMNKPLYVSSSAGSSGATLTLNQQLGSTVLLATGSVIITGSLSVNGNTITSLAAGAFNSTQTQSGSAAVSQSMTFNNSDINNQGISVQSSSQLTITNGGTYNIQFSAELLTSTGQDDVYIWLKKNGTNVSNSATKVVLANNDAIVAAWNWVVTAGPSEYFEIVWQSRDGHATLSASNSTGNIPSIPSVIATVTQVN